MTPAVQVPDQALILAQQVVQGESQIESFGHEQVYMVCDELIRARASLKFKEDHNDKLCELISTQMREIGDLRRRLERIRQASQEDEP